MNITIKLYGNPYIEVLNSSILIKAGDQYGVFYVSAKYDANETIAYSHFLKVESTTFNKYQDIYPMLFGIGLLQNINILVPDFLSMYIGGVSFFIEISLSDIPNVNLSITLSSNFNEVFILGNSSLNFKENRTINRFRIKLLENASSENTYYIGLSIESTEYSNIFKLSNDIIFLKTSVKPTNLNEKSLTFQADTEIYCKCIDILISNFNYPVLVYYEIYLEELMNASKPQEIIDSIDNSIDYRIIYNNYRVIGVFVCNDTNSICKEKIMNLEQLRYNLQIFIYSTAGVISDMIYNGYFEPYRKFSFIYL